MTVTAAFRLKVLGGALLGLLVAITVVTLISGRREAPRPVAESRPAEVASAPAAPPAGERAAPAVLALARPGRVDVLLPAR